MPRTCFQERLRASVGRASARQDVVHQDDVTALDTPAIGNLESAAHLSIPLRRAHPAQRSRSPYAFKQAGAMLESQPFGQRLGNQDRLVEPASPQPAPVQWDPDKNRILRNFGKRREQGRHRLCGADLATIFQFHHKRPAQLAIFHDGARPRDQWRTGEAFTACRFLGGLQRQAAMLAPCIATPRNGLPTVGAEGVHFRDDRTTAPAAGRKREIDCEARPTGNNAGNGIHGLLLRAICFRTSGAVNHLDPRRLSAKEARAARITGDNFLRVRALEECIDRLRDLRGHVGRVIIVDSSTLGSAEPQRILDADSFTRLPLESLEPGCADVIIAAGVLDHAPDPSVAAFVLRHALKPGGRLLGATIGSGSLPRMRRAFIDAERATGRAAQHFHPLPDAKSLSALLVGGGFSDVVIDVDGFNVRYSSLDDLIRDLRSMGCTSSLAGSVPSISREVYAKAHDIFSSGAERVEERFEILHFSGVAKMKV